MIQLSKYVIQKQSEVIADMLMQNGSMRLYEGAQRPFDVRTDGRLCECKITSATIADGVITVEWEDGTVIKDGVAGYYRLVSGNIPVMSGSIPDQMQIDNAELKVNTIINAGTLVHTVFRAE